MAAVEFPPQPPALLAMLAENNVPDALHRPLSQLYADILETYPLGHGYFAGLDRNADATAVISYYKARVRPVIGNYLGVLKKQELEKIDNMVDELFGGRDDSSGD